MFEGPILSMRGCRLHSSHVRDFLPNFGNSEPPILANLYQKILLIVNKCSERVSGCLSFHHLAYHFPFLITLITFLSSLRLSLSFPHFAYHFPFFFAYHFPLIISLITFKLLYYPPISDIFNAQIFCDFGNQRMLIMANVN